MSLTIISLGIFLALSGLLISGIYFVVEAPARRGKMRARLAAVQQIARAEAMDSLDAEIIRQHVLSRIPRINQLLLKLPFLAEWQLFLEQSATRLTLLTLVSISLWAGVAVQLASILLRLPVIFSIPLTIAGMAVPFIVLAIRRSRRFSRFEELFPDAMDMLARAVRAGYAFTTGLELIAQEMPDPIAREFRITYEQQNLGLPLKEALGNLAVRVPLEDVHIFVTALQIQRESGGNMAETLDNLSYLIRERFKLYRQVRVYTAEGRMSLYILTALPPIAAVLLYFVNPGYMATLFNDPIGQKCLIAAAGLQVLGY